MSEQKKILNYNTLPEMFFKQAKKNSFKPLLWFKKNNKYTGRLNVDTNEDKEEYLKIK